MSSRVRVLTLASALLLASSVQAADLIIDPHAPVSPEAYDWTGAYIGAHAGYMTGTVDVDYEGIPGGGDIDGFLAGLYAGYNLHSDGVVFGVEGDFELGGVSGNGYGGPPPAADYYTYRLDWNAHVRGRVGLPADHTLFYLAGGLAVASHALEIDYGSMVMAVGGDTQVHVGWTIGAGAELALAENMVVRAEYLYDDYGSKVYTDQHVPPEDYDVHLTAHALRAGLSLKF